MNQTAYQKRLIAIRRLNDAAQEIAEKRLASLLRRAADDLTRLMNLAGPEKVSYSVYAAKRAGIRKLLNNLSRSMDFAIRTELKGTIQDAVDVYGGLQERFTTGKTNLDWAAILETVPERALNNTISRIWGDGFSYSDRIWRMNSYAQESIKEIIGSGISRGQSAVNMAKDLRDFLVDPQITPETSWTTGIKPSITGRGTIHYNALRLARTEINNAYRESLVVANAENPIMLGVKWNLSKTHTVPDICDIWASTDAYGLGAGIYPADKTPIDHPNGRCFLTEVMRPASQWNTPKPQAEEQDISKDEVLSALGDVSKGQRNAAWKMWSNTNELIAKAA